MRTKMIAGNWKMNNNRQATKDFVEALETWFEEDAAGQSSASAVDSGKIEIVIAPPFTSLESARAARRTKNIRLAAQNAYHQRKGAFTGEISLPMLEEAGCRYAIIGHSERRHVFNESNEELEKKLIATLESRVLPIFCVGELLEERKSGKTEQVISTQLASAWRNLTSDVVGEMLVIAYEPVWAIGTGQTASEADAEDACDYIRTLVYEKFGNAACESLRILYGGSVKPDNSKKLLKQANIDGLLIGGASLEIESFKKIIATSF